MMEAFWQQGVYEKMSTNIGLKMPRTDLKDEKCLKCLMSCLEWL